LRGSFRTQFLEFGRSLRVYDKMGIDNTINMFFSLIGGYQTLLLGITLSMFVVIFSAIIDNVDI
jgi:hypothetical protein